MSADADLLADRRTLRRRLTLWRMLALAGAVVAIGTIGYFASGRTSLTTGKDHVARIEIKGVITGDKRTLDMIKAVKDAKNVSAVLVRIESPGGTVTGSEALHESLRALSAAKPTVAVIDGAAASGGYIAALGTERIFARQTSLVGSIGVLFQYPNVGKLMETLGVKLEEIKSSPLKAAPNAFEPASPEARAALQAVVNDNYDWFKRMVRDRRKMNDAELNAVADGKVHSGTRAAALKLIDQVGGESEARAWLASEKKISADLTIRDWRRKSETDRLGLWSASETLARAAGLDTLATIIARAAVMPEGLQLDGALALWQPPVER
ncbi:MAG: signal peptide peptidase SppA [Bosea sp. (in: a-proteobacteria)]